MLDSLLKVSSSVKKILLDSLLRAFVFGKRFLLDSRLSVFVFGPRYLLDSLRWGGRTAASGAKDSNPAT